MVHKDIYSHVDLQALQGICSESELRAQQGIMRPDERVFVRMVSLESVRIAHESYALLRSLVNRRSCFNPQLDGFSVVASLSLELHRVERDLLPPLQDHQEANKLLDGRVVQALLSMKNSGVTLLRLGKELEQVFVRFGEELEDGEVSDRVREVGMVLKDTADQMLNGIQDMSLVKVRVPLLVELVSALMATPVRFP